MKFLIIALLLSSSLFASNWDELDTKTTYKLSQSFQLPQTERSGSILELVRGQKFELKEILPLEIPGALLTLYIFDYPKCSGLDMKTEMEIIPVDGTSPVVEVGALVEKCELQIYLETKDLDSNSLFE
jgi:hypothetical protein